MKPRDNNTYWKNPVVVILSTVVFFLGSQMLAALLIYPLTTSIADKNILLAVQLAVHALVVVTCIQLLQNVIGFRWSSLNLVKPRVKSLAVVLPAVLLYFTVSYLVTLLAALIFSQFNVNQSQDIGFQEPTGALAKVAIFVSLAVLTPFIEEVIFRGLLFSGLRKKLPFWAATTLVSGLFALAHAQWNVAVDTFVLSLVLCYLVERTRSIWPAFLLHALKNAVAFTALFLIK